jgi:uncharacterized protein involved in exopolysaccharide biosynthesis
MSAAPRLPRSSPSPASIVASLVERWRMLAGVAILTAAGAFAVRTLVVPRRYKAEAVLVAVSSQKLPTSLGSLAALPGLTGAAGMGVTATPDVVAELLTSRRVLVEVGLSRVPGAPPPGRVVDGIVGAPSAGMPLAQIVRRMRSVASVQVDKRTGFVEFAIAHEDSALSRLVATRMIDAASRALSEMMRSQASAQRRGLETRVDSMAAWLRTAELRLADLQAGNRVIAEYSTVGLSQQRLVREMGVAQQAYLQAVTERESAIAKELEQTRALLVVDPLPTELEMLPRFAAFYAIAAAVGVTFIVITLIYLREAVARLGTASEPDAQRLRAAVRGVPVVRRWVAAPDARAP